MEFLKAHKKGLIITGSIIAVGVVAYLIFHNKNTQVQYTVTAKDNAYQH